MGPITGNLVKENFMFGRTKNWTKWTWLSKEIGENLRLTPLLTCEQALAWG